MVETPVRVHVVEDNKRIGDMYRKWLADEYVADISYTGEDALAAIDEDVDVVVLDHDLPGINGGEVLSQLRDRDADYTVAMLTATNPSLDLADLECDDYLRKPIPEEALRSKVADLVARHDRPAVVREYLAVASRAQLLEEKFSPRKLRGDEQYARLSDRLAELRERAERTGNLTPDDVPDLQIADN